MTEAADTLSRLTCCTSHSSVIGGSALGTLQYCIRMKMRHIVTNRKYYSCSTFQFVI